MSKIMVDVLFMADHFVLVTTIETEYSPDSREVEDAAWKRLADEYGDEWTTLTRSVVKQVSIEVVPGTSADEVNTIPQVGDPSDTGQEQA